ncbi:MAG: hypothetical protein WBD98_09105, partial [Acidobacteriaceae bacterium]
LVAGAPQSFIEPLSQPIYTQRPEVPVPEAANIAPVMHEGAMETRTGSSTGGGTINGAPMPMPQASQTVMVNGANVGQLQTQQAQLRSQIHGSGTGGGVGGGTYRKWLNEDVRYLQDESASASSAKFDDYFEYTVAQPVTIHKNESALVPVLQTNVQADHVTLYNAASPVPLRALWLTNSSNLTLDRGSFSIFENNEFAGEGLTDTIHAGEKRLLSYAVDQAVHVTTEGHLNSTHLHHLTIHDGIMTERNEEIREVTYVVHNAASDSRNVIVEHPVQSGWKLTSEVKPVETSASFYRFSVAAQAGETVRLHVGESYTQGVSYQLTGVGDDQMEVILNGSGDRLAIQKALAPVLAARARVHDLDTQIDVKQAAIDDLAADQKRLHDNLAGLKDSAEERELARRYAGEMNTDEDQLLIARKDRAVLDQQRKEAQQALDAAIRALDLDQDV